MKDVCFIIPTYPPRYDYARNLLKSFFRYKFDKQADLWFMFTNQKERDEFWDYDYTVVLPDSLRVDKGKTIVNIKKMYALHELKNKYKYFIILDDEALFIKNVNVINLCNKYFENKLLYGNKCADSVSINKPTFNKLKISKDYQYDKKRMEYILDNLYLRWNNLSIFRWDDLDDFFEKINYSHATLKEWERSAFFEMTYCYYLIVYKWWNVIDLWIEAYNSLLEYSWYITYWMKKKIKKLVALYDFYWSSSNMLKLFDNPNCFIVFHLDRENLKFYDHMASYLHILSLKSKAIWFLLRPLQKLYRYFRK